LNIWAGGHGFFVLTESSAPRLFSCGANSFGQLGHPSKQPISSPFEIEDFLPSGTIVQIACGLQHTLLLDSAGHVYGLGRGDDGRLGCEHVHDVIRPNRIEHLNDVVDIAAGGSVSFARDNRGQIFSFGMGDTCQTGHGNEDIFVPTLIKGKQLEQRSIQQISVGAQHTLFLVTENDCLNGHGFSP
jgi:alpha-tubulin suppressor-like RCC1 family protein